MKNSEFVVGKPIPQPDRNAGTDLLKVLFIGLLFAIPLLIYVALSVSYMAVEYQISQLISQKEELKRQRAVLVMQKEKLLSLENVQKTASEKLNMVKENPTEIRIGWDGELLKAGLEKERAGQ